MKACYSSIFEQEFPTAAGELIKIDRIIIPKIQRAYAQGRKDEKYIRNNFLNEIFLCLTEGREMDLNFIYGSVKKLERTNVMELIDGQQRITTLFLLYWYIGNRELVHESEGYALLQDRLSRFTYETRVTSANFCQMLSSFRGDLEQEQPSIVIKRSKWYFKAYDKDATVESMLTMLDAICKKYNEHISQFPEQNLYDKLSLLQFQVLSLGAFGLSEELYIKMNSRGLPLSSFDNFKAELTEYLRHTDVGKEIVSLTNSFSGNKVPRYLDFSTNLDTNWIHIFWSSNNQQFDSKYFRFFYLYLGYKYLMEGSNEKMQYSSIAKYFLDKESLSDTYKGFTEFKNRFDEHPEYFKTISTVLNVLSEHYKKDIISQTAPSWDDGKFSMDVFESSNRKKELVFFATTEFIEAYEAYYPEEFRKWMRVAWSIIENMETDNLSSVSGVARNLSKIIRYIAANRQFSFYEAFFLYGEDESSKASPKAVREEIIKAGRIAEDPNWEKTFILAESHPFLKGTTSFFYSDNISIEQFSHRFDILSELLTADGVSPIAQSEGHIFLRSLLSQVTDWDEIYYKYLMDRAESQRFFKLFLTNTTSIHDFICSLFDSDTLDNAFDMMRIAITKDSQMENPLHRRVHTLLYKNANLQDWLQEHNAVHLAYYHDNIYIKRPYHAVFKVMLDTKRNQFVPDIIDNFGYKYADPNQAEFWDKTHLYFGNELIIQKNTSAADVRISFSDFSTYYIYVKPSGRLKKDQFLAFFNLDDSSVKDGSILITNSGNYASDNAYNEICEKFLRPIDKILDSDY